MELSANKINIFTIKCKDVIKTYYSLFEQFNAEKVTCCEIDVVLFDKNYLQYNYRFVHETDARILTSELDEKALGNILAIASEHEIEEAKFGVLYRKDF